MRIKNWLVRVVFLLSIFILTSCSNDSLVNNPWTPEVLKSTITLCISNLILLIMILVWARISLKRDEVIDISPKFIVLGAILAGSEVVKALLTVKDMLWP